MTFIDTHTHIYDEAFSGEEDAVIGRALEAGVKTMLQPDVDSRERDAMFALVGRHPKELRAMLGLYPGSVDKAWRDEIDAMLRYRDRDIVAIGEIGLDYHYGAEFAAEQKEAFRVQLELAAEMGLPVNIHLREATDDFFSIMDSCAGSGLRGSLHAFSGSYETFMRVQKYGEWYVGIGGVVTFRKASLAEAVKRIPLDRIILETDSPYLTPVPHRGERNESMYIPLIAEKIAELKGIGKDEVAEVTTANARRLFNLK
ncbi:MAG: TatD family hydrolase [Bacteroidales bacterium]|nr:TatD family hydrolase [Bacteroidales bacterium]MBP5719653.1 TatD family hydrolase [Bacteroidales bacterium]